MFHNKRKTLRWLGIAALAVLVLLAATQRKQLQPAGTVDSEACASGISSAADSLPSDTVHTNSENKASSDGSTVSADHNSALPDGDDMETSGMDPSSESVPAVQADGEAEKRETVSRQKILDLLGLNQPLPLEKAALLEELQARIDAAQTPDALELDHLPFAARCAALMQCGKRHGWVALGIVDIDQDGCPEFFAQTNSALSAAVYIYDISDSHPQLLCRFGAGDGSGRNSAYDYSPVVLPEGYWDVWQVYATVFPNSSPGGIIETSGHWRNYCTYFFTSDDAQFPLETPLRILAEGDDIYEPEKSEEIYKGAWYTLSQVRLNGDLLKSAAVFAVEGRNDDFPLTYEWNLDTTTREEFWASVEGSWLDVLCSLPRLRWSSPMVREECLYKSLEETLQIAEDLYAEYNAKLASGNY